jgi:hypothetical protein
MATSIRNRLIATGVLALLVVGAVLLVTQVDLSGSANEPTPTSSILPALFPDIESSVVDEFAITNNSSGDAFAVHLAPSEEWENDSPTWIVDKAPEGADTGLGVNHDQIGGASLSLASMKPTRALENISDLAEFGLDNPAYTLTFSVIENDDTYTLQIGRPSPGGTGYYVQPGGVPADTIYIIPDFAVSPVINMLTASPYLQPTPEPTAEGDNSGG